MKTPMTLRLMRKFWTLYPAFSASLNKFLPTSKRRGNVIHLPRISDSLLVAHAEGGGV